jgi:protein SCO1
MKAKGIYLFLLILLPVLIFLFLKGFGKNQFDIPVLYPNGVIDTLEQVSCIDRSPGQYIAKAPELELGVVKIIQFEETDGPVLKTRLEELEKVQDIFYKNSKMRLTTYLNNTSIQANSISNYNRRITFYDQFWKFEELDSATWSSLKSCALIMTELDNRVVLVDAENKIRGYYNIMEREETDRLILELRILQSKEND